MVSVLFLIPIIFTSFLAIYGSIDNATYDEDAVIVLGAGIDGEKVSGNLAKRLDMAAAYYEKNPKAVIIVCGGQGPQEDITEALAMERYLVGKGVPKDSILKEEKSTSTYENFSYGKTILEDHFTQEFSSVLITNDFHVFRAAKIAEDAGITSNRLGAQTKWYTVPANYLREMLAVLKMLIIPA